jgi:hypothetical protein
MTTGQIETVAGNSASITIWNRLEPVVRDGSMQRSLQAQIRDPLWFLARQWQMAEFAADDSGSPIHASVLVESRSVTTYRPGPGNSVPKKINPLLPVEVHVERETVDLRLRGAIQLGLYFERLVRASSNISQPDQAIDAFRRQFPVHAAAPSPELAPEDAIRLRSIVAASESSSRPIPGRVVDGVALYSTALAIASGGTPAIPLPPGYDNQDILQILSDLVSFRQALFSEPSGDSAWQATKLDYDFALESPGTDDSISLVANDFKGGHVDWFSFSLESSAPSSASSPYPAVIDSEVFDLLPNHVVFRGMPDPRWWNFEDGATDFGQLDADHVDLPKLLVMEFALVFGNDWFSIPIPIRLAPPAPPSSGSSAPPVNLQGTLSRITSLVVTDTFGVRTVIRPSEQTQTRPNEVPWSIYKLSTKNRRSDFILMAPKLGVTQDASAIEEVAFLRDDMAAMAWAVEHHLHSDLDAPLDAHQMFVMQASNQQGNAAPGSTGQLSLAYSIEHIPPENWVPLVPVLSNQRAPYLRRGSLEIPDASASNGFRLQKVFARVLEPGAPFFVVDHAVPRSGLKVTRRFRYGRSFYGSSFLWLGRESGIGKGPGWSGLRFDTLDTQNPTTS